MPRKDKKMKTKLAFLSVTCLIASANALAGSGDYQCTIGGNLFTTEKVDVPLNVAADRAANNDDTGALTINNYEGDLMISLRHQDSEIGTSSGGGPLAHLNYRYGCLNASVICRKK
jgi:hypothetical protein